MTGLPAVPASGPGAASTQPQAVTVYRPGHPLNLRRVLAPLRRGAFDPTTTQDSSGVWRTAATPAGPGLLHLRVAPGGEIHASAWGPGADWLIDGVPELLGAADNPEEFIAAHPLLAGVVRSQPGLRIGRCRLVFEMLAAAVIEQKVTGREARRSWAALVRRFGTRPPGPAPSGLMVAPTAEGWRRIPSWAFHRAGVDDARARALVGAARMPARLEATLDLADPAAAEPVLRSLPGIGVWTAAEVRFRAHGDADAVSYGDFHVAANVGWALTGRPLDDEELAALLAPWAGHRGRVVALVEASGFRKPRFGPRYAGRDYRAM